MPVDYKDYYAVLGVPRDATPDQIKQAFRTLARKYHPDVAGDKKTAEEKFKEINEANEVLGDPEKRRRYDDLGSQWQDGQGFQPPPRRQGRRQGEPEFHFRGTGFSDFFEHFFAGGWRSPSGDQPFSDDQRAGADIEGDILVSLDEAMRGTIRPISLQLVDPRTGEVQVDTLQVRIPPGATQGRRIRVPGRGEPGAGVAPAGDLYLRVRHAAHPDFEAQGFDLHRRVELPPWDAVLGAEVEVRTLDGTIKLRVPAGTTAGRVLRIKGHGLPKEKGGERGDLYARIEIILPPATTDDERAAWERLRKLALAKNHKGAP